MKMKMILDDKNPRIRGCEFYEKYISCDSRVPGESFKLSHGPRFLGKTVPPLRLRAFARPNRRIAARCHCHCHHCHHCLPVFFGVMSQEQKPGCVCFFWVVGEILKSHFWDFLCDL